MEIFLIFFILLEQINSFPTPQNVFSIRLIGEDTLTRNAYYVSPAIDNNGDIYIITGENGNFPQYTRHISKFDINLMDVTNDYYYFCQCNFDFGEAYVIGDNPKYFFLTTYIANEDYGTSDFLELTGTYLAEGQNNDIEGYKRFFKKVGNYYYLARITGGRSGPIRFVVKRMELDLINNPGTSRHYPFINIITNNYDQIHLEYQAMFSCDLTNYPNYNNNFILCTYFSLNKKAELSIFDNNLNLKNKIELDDTPEEWPDNGGFIKILYFKDNSKFILACRRGNSKMRFRYFEYK